MTADSEHSIVYVGCTAPGRNVLEALLEHGLPIDSVVTIDPEMAEANAVSGYASLRPTAEAHDLEVYHPRTYSMTDAADLDHFRTIDPDLLIVNGWQRLIPESILETATHGALGNHGSAFGLPKGRGRSPLNWSLIEDRDRFLLSVIRLDPGADSGDVVTTRKFDVTEFDTIETLYYKVSMCLETMLLEVVEPILEGERPFEPQTGEPTYYPKRTPEDGEVHWADGTRELYNLVRAVADPYPGAFTYVDGDGNAEADAPSNADGSRNHLEQVMIWEAIPFSSDLAKSAPPGTIVEVFWTDEFVVATGDGTLLVREWEVDSTSDWEPAVGDRFDSRGEPDRVDRPDQHENLSSSNSNTGTDSGQGDRNA
ncbi:methionyl-tRNA formyltransferase [Natronosalvus halobius]|uniref:methionyl-tRNA formyltransferase n=1 Tax=Natronosalvus halobius TaxID=2953746 RepID=UPI00209F80E7|nr:methionyl-tRNA formyltransferase [Natronosalvus halobius]USZ72903.1 methionyl-tRNA formyltransferase [Natronosalvus halobius]